MALIACHECKKEVSTEAKTCPSCGAKVRNPASTKMNSRQKVFVASCLALIVFASIMGAKEREEREAQEEAARTPEQRAMKKKEEMQDGLAAAGAATLKKAMKDPKSFALTSALVMDDGTACYDYRAINSFGATLPSRAVMLPSGKILTKDHDGGSFSNAWNSKCAHKSGRELTKIIELMGVLQ